MVYCKECAKKELLEELRELIPLILESIRSKPEEIYRNRTFSGTLAPYFKNYFNTGL